MSSSPLAATVPTPCHPSLMGTICNGIKTGYEAFCQGVDWAGRTYVELSEKACGGHKQIAAIARVAINTLSALGLTFALTSVLPIPAFLTCGLISLGEMAINRFREKPLYSITGMTAQFFLESATFSSPFIRMLSLHRFAPLSVVLHALTALFSGIALIQRSDAHFAEEMGLEQPAPSA